MGTVQALVIVALLFAVAAMVMLPDFDVTRAFIMALTGAENWLAELVRR